MEDPGNGVIIKWAGKEIPLPDLKGVKTVGDLKVLIQEKTGVQPERQKLLNLSFKGKQASNEMALSQFNLKPNQKIMMMGSLEKDIQNVDVPPEDRPEVQNDLDIGEDEDDLIENQQIHLAKIDRRVQDYQVVERYPPRDGKKLLVLDIDYTLLDHRSPAESGAELMRPHLHEFLTNAYKNYDIAIWSATSMKWIQEKMKLLGVLHHETEGCYKIVFFLDYLAMISVHTQKYGVVEVKPLGVIWGKYPTFYNSKNTIMLDDLRRNFLMNPQNGLQIRPFRSAHLTRLTDRELPRIGRYLKRIASLDDLSTLNHRRWESYLNRSRDKQRKSHRHRSKRRNNTPEQHEDPSPS